jgi:hypothetical protein
MNQYLTHKVQQWTILGAIPEALPIRDREDWLLTLCFRAKLASVLSCLTVLVPVVGVVILHSRATDNETDNSFGFSPHSGYVVSHLCTFHVSLQT